MGRPVETYLDIEHDEHRRPTIVGFWSRQSGKVQLCGEEITARRLSWWLPKSGVLFTYNGRASDLNVLRRCLGLDLERRFAHRDVMYLCRENKMRGSQKVLERRAGYVRPAKPLNWWQIRSYWRSYQLWDDRWALQRLLDYNWHDVQGLHALKCFVDRKCRN
jgi:uncharacterized protein YprB with RNaseH-like and TPR domain